MSVWSNLFSGLQQAALLKDKVDRALQTAQEAQKHSTENRDRIIALETMLELSIPRGRYPPRLPRG